LLLVADLFSVVGVTHLYDLYTVYNDYILKLCLNFSYLISSPHIN